MTERMGFTRDVIGSIPGEGLTPVCVCVCLCVFVCVCMGTSYGGAWLNHVFSMCLYVP